MSNEIRISPKYGLNPTMPVCFWCGEEKGEIAILGYIEDEDGNEIEAPRSCCLDYNPCDKCQKAMEQGVTIISVTECPNGRPEIQDGFYPTGDWCVIKEEAAERFGIEGKKVLMHETAFKGFTGGGD